MTEESTQQLKRIIEGALFAAGEPMSVDHLLSLFEEDESPDRKAVRDALKSIAEEYAERGIELREVASGFQFQVKADLSKWIRRLWTEKPARYSRALLETLALVAYRQPITRGEIEEIRGVTVSSQMFKTLLDREWVKIVGYRDVAGKPGLYATTRKFLDHFGLKSLSELPPLSEIHDLDKAAEQLEAELGDVAEENSSDDGIDVPDQDEVVKET